MKKILLIGMVDSIHTANWIERIVDIDSEIHIFPSRTHRRIHPQLQKLIKDNQNLRLMYSFPSQRLSPYLDYLTRKVNFSKFSLTSWLLKRAIETKTYSHVHCLEIQHAGYLLLEIKSDSLSNVQIICTNWGSDIYFFSQFDSHLKKIKELLNLIDMYAAECERDYELARNLGFNGKELPLIPNSFRLNVNAENQKNVKDKSQVIVKCYGETFGLGGILISVMDQFLNTRQDASALLFSVTDDLLSDAKNLEKKFPNRVRISSIRNSMSSSKIAEEYQQSRVYIGASRSDGISTSFLEAMNYGVFPIQTNTSCAQDWIEKGCVGKVVNPDRELLFNALNDVYYDFDTIAAAAETNLKLLRDYTDASLLKEVSKSFYR